MSTSKLLEKFGRLWDSVREIQLTVGGTSSGPRERQIGPAISLPLFGLPFWNLVALQESSSFCKILALYDTITYFPYINVLGKFHWNLTDLVHKVIQLSRESLDVPPNLHDGRNALSIFRKLCLGSRQFTFYSTESHAATVIKTQLLPWD